MGSQTSRRRSPPASLVALEAATQLNDILNALGLRLALLRHQANPSLPTTGNIERLAGLVDKAVDCVRNLQDYMRAEHIVRAIRTALIEEELEHAGADLRREHTGRIKVLLIGEERSDDALIKKGLERSGCDVIVATSAAGGLEALVSEPQFDNIVCDSEILTANGWNFAGQVSRAAPAAKVYLLQNDKRSQGPALERHSA